MKYVTGNIFDSGCDAIVNTVNCVGVMGKGLALQVKEQFPDVYKKYKIDCNNGLVKTGQVICYEGNANTKWIINFPTKQHWKDPSKSEWIESGLESLRLKLIELAPLSVAIPKLGCANGGLDWKDVKFMIEGILYGLPDYINITVYE